ncbi:MAG: gliding motility-associated-like protein [Flavobacteriaceae bacterium]|jgi:gliding motility-associated-like protein
MTRLLVVLLICSSSIFTSRADHVMGGDITWTCQGGDYVFQLVFYRDCNGGIINATNETIDVWGHPTLSEISLPFVSRTDISPICTEVPTGPTALACGTGASGGNGIGAIEKIIYRSLPITLAGTPPASGWVFTYQNFSRNAAVVNLDSPGTKGLTLTSKMFAVPGSPGGCVDNSPQFLQDPYFVSCSGDPYTYNMNAVDPDLDSMHVSFGTALDHFPGQTYNPPTIPAPLVYAPGFSATSPTPGIGMDPGNIPAQIAPSSGQLTFLSNNSGLYAVKIVARSYRNGVLIAEVDREIQLIVVNCAGTNNPPVIAGPFGGLFETTINAGDLVNFNLTSTDVELLQDGSPQSNHLSASGPMFGTNFTSVVGCAIGPCATLDATPLITMSQGVTTTFNWQTSCDHLVTPYGVTEDQLPYHFVFKIQDDYCPIPKVSYATITINVKNPGVIQAPQINCIQSDATGDVTITWDPVTDPLGTFTEYQIYTDQSGLIGTIPAIGTTTFTDPGVTQENDYIIAVASGCNGNSIGTSDTIKNIFLNLTNPLNGTAVLQWNDPVTPPTAGMNAFYHLYREYPAGTWTLHDSVPYGTNLYRDTIDICDTFLNYQVVLPNQPCDFTSNIEGDQFQDMMTPDIPIMTNVTIDTLTNLVSLTWNQNEQPDTYGYVIYTLDLSGFLVEIDTNWGIANTTYIDSPNTALGPLTYSVAAFDSCWTTSIPPTYQTSAKAPAHTTVFVNANLDICTKSVLVDWSDYVGWNNLDHYEVYGKWEGQAWTVLGSTTSTILNVDVLEGKNYCFTIKSISLTGVESFSNISCVFISSPSPPAFNYLQVATVYDDHVRLRQHIDPTVPLQALSFQRKNDNGVFEEIAQVPMVGSTTVSITDEDVNVDEQSYVYRVQTIDSCGLLADITNEAETILMHIQADDVAKLIYLNWNAYREFDGSILGYNIYRGIDRVFSSVPFATVASNTLSFVDDINNVISTGKICYYLEAIEATNSYNISEISRSNIVCAVIPPTIYIPNAFMPDGINKVFKPIISDFDATAYDFIVFNRWGQIMFRTNYYDEGWNGAVRQNGQMAANGTYLYTVSVTDGNGVEVVTRGHVTLVK